MSGFSKDHPEVRQQSLLDKQENKRRKVKRRISNASRKVNQEKARHNKFTR